jgi:integration host factor subunit alpha
MTKADLTAAIFERTDLLKTDAAEILDELLKIIKQTLESDEEVKILGFGKFEVKKKRERRGRDPQTGEEITITPRKIVAFKPSEILKERLNQP